MESLDALPLSPRLQYGSKGGNVSIMVNAFNVKRFPDLLVNHYDVAITPANPPLPARVGREIFQHLEKIGAFEGVPAVYDGKKNMYTPKRLPWEDDEKTLEISLGSPDQDPRSQGEKAGPKSRKFGVKMRKVAEVNLHELALHFNKAQPAGAPRPLEQLSPNLNLQSTINALQLVLIHNPFLLYANQKTSFFPDPAPQDKTDLGRAVDMWRGFSTSLRPGPGRLIVNVDLAALPVIQSGNLVKIAVELLQKRGPEDLARLQERDRIDLDRYLKGITIAVRGKEKDGSDRIRKYKLRGVERVPANQDMFDLKTVKNGKEVTEKVSVAAYWEREMNKKLQFPTLPAVRGSNTAKLPMEVCTVELRQKWTRKLTPEQTTKALQFTQKNPTERARYVRQGIEYIFPNNATNSPKVWGIDIDKTDLIRIAARQLPAPELAFSQNMRAMDGQWNMRALKYNSPAKVINWAGINFDDRFPMAKAEECMRALYASAVEAGMSWQSPQPMEMIQWNSRQHSRDILGFIKEKLAAYKPQVVVCFLPTNSGWQYAQIKRFGDCDTGTVTQCLATMKFARRLPNQSYWANVALKLNIKLGGKNHILTRPSLGIFGQKPTILFGADVNHPGPDSLSPSIAAVVGSLDPHAAAYGTQIKVQSSRVEMIDGLEEMTKNLLRQFHGKNKVAPHRIIFYRDGVSEGQFQQCLRDEIPKIKKACVSIDKNYKPAITFVVVGKRHNFRFFPTSTDAKNSDKSGNVKAGTVIDREIVSPFENDFYLNSHTGLLGTSKPSHYTVIYDDSNFTADQIQELSYNLCYSYARSTRSVSIVTPAYYSHHVAYRAKLMLSDGETTDDTTSATGSSREQVEMKKLQEYIANLPKIHSRLADKLYFL